MNKSTNPSAIRSRKLIVAALLTLMDHRKYTEITITDLAKEAQIGRKTFYRHFYSLEDVLDEYIDELLAEYRMLLISSNIHSIYEHIPLYFHFWSNHMDFLQLLQKNDLLFFILKKYELLFPELLKLLPCQLEHSGITYDYFLSYMAGGFWSLLNKWVSRGGIESPDELAEIFRHFFSKFASTFSPHN